MQIQNLNTWVDVARAEIMEKYQTTEQDKTMYLLQSAHVEEGDYFRSRVHKDMDGILEDIRNAHVGRNDGAPKTSVAEELRQDLEEVAAFEGSRAEQLLLVFCSAVSSSFCRFYFVPKILSPASPSPGTI